MVSEPSLWVELVSCVSLGSMASDALDLLTSTVLRVNSRVMVATLAQNMVPRPLICDTAQDDTLRPVAFKLISRSDVRP